MGKRGVLPLVVALTLGVAPAACSPEPVPDTPSFQTDVRPIMLARCVRCHGAGGTMNADPDAQGGYTYPPPNGYFDRYEDRGSCGQDGGPFLPDCQYGVVGYAMTIKNYTHGQNGIIMPPPPAPRLTDHQQEIIDRWASTTPPRP